MTLLRNVSFVLLIGCVFAAKQANVLADNPPGRPDYGVCVYYGYSESVCSGTCDAADGDHGFCFALDDWYSSALVTCNGDIDWQGSGPDVDVTCNGNGSICWGWQDACEDYCRNYFCWWEGLGQYDYGCDTGSAYCNCYSCEG
jgi:hypothetical protein